MASQSMGFSSVPIAVCVWCAFGLSQAFSAFLWAIILSEQSFRQNVSTLAFSAILSVILFLLSSIVVPNALSILATMGLLLLQIVIAMMLTKDATISSMAKEGLVSSSCDESVSKPSVWDNVWTTCFNAVYGFMLVLGGVQSFTGALVIGACGIIGALSSVVLKVAEFSKLPSGKRVQQWSLPVMVTALMLIPLSNSVGIVACAGCAVAMHSLGTLLDWCDNTNSVTEFRLSPIKRFIQGATSKHMGILVGTLVAYLVLCETSPSNSAIWMIIVVLAACLLFSYTMYSISEENRAARLQEELELAALRPRDGDEAFQEACARVARENGLSRREAQILELLARGRNAKHIQQHCYISLSTARTHIYRIYKKVGVSSQQMLIDVVEKSKNK